MKNASNPADLASRLPVRRGLSAADAALYLGIGATMFRQMVQAGDMPRPRMIGSRRLWDIDELDIAFKALPRDGGEDEADTWADVGRASR